MTVGKAVITPDSTTALFLAQSGVNDVLFVNLNTRVQTTMGGDLAGYTTTAIDIEEGGQYAWVHDPVNEVLIIIDIAARSTVSGGGMGAPGLSPHGRFLGRLIFTNAGAPNTISTDADLTSSLFGQEVLVGGTVNINDGFSSARTFRFVGAAPAPQPRLRHRHVQRASDGVGIRGGDRILGDPAHDWDRLAERSHRRHGGVTLQADGTHSGPITLQSTAILSGTGAVAERHGEKRQLGAARRRQCWHPDRGRHHVRIGQQPVHRRERHDRRHRPRSPGHEHRDLIQPNVALQTSRGYTPAPGDTFTILTNVSAARPIRSTAFPAAAATTSPAYNTTSATTAARATT